MARQLTALGHQVLGIDISRTQIERAGRLVPNARFLHGDVSDASLEPASFDGIVCLYLLIHLPLPEQQALIRNISVWLRPGGVLLATTGATAWTGQEPNWLGAGAAMWWSHPDAGTYREWLTAAGFTIEHDEFVPEGASGHQLFLARSSEGKPPPP
jgi:2-polyprenyl-3-methyl-5-hydroxy-6-metoxy-1,4-benzoquinol methylase